ncbi:MAG TPA: neutral zinc metallopeptidase [Gemmatimonadaceae bacterium]|nr:neutral zinc metallopeptidase [Gemmatimonadaceae bacterium]
MRWNSGGRSPNLEDRRGSGGGFGMPMGIGGGIITLILALIFGPGILSNGNESTSGGEVGLTPADSAREEPMVQFVSFVLDDAQSTWQGAFQRAGGNFRPAKMVLFRDGTMSGCGGAQSAMGPFYCPLDEKLYLDLGFFEELDKRFGAPGDFAQAYVIAHELGHHVQHLLGIDQRVRDAQQRNPDAANQLSVRLELQADCYAGVWAHSAAERGKLEAGDIQEGLGAASAVGDDRIQRQTTGSVNVDSFTHGSAQQRSQWFARGYESGNSSNCDTFGGG